MFDKDDYELVMNYKTNPIGKEQIVLELWTLDKKPEKCAYTIDLPEIKPNTQFEVVLETIRAEMKHYIDIHYKREIEKIKKDTTHKVYYGDVNNCNEITCHWIEGDVVNCKDISAVEIKGDLINCNNINYKERND